MNDADVPSLHILCEDVDDFVLLPIYEDEAEDAVSTASSSTPRLGAVYHEDFSTLFSSRSPNRLVRPQKVLPRKEDDSSIVDFLLEKARAASSSSPPTCSSSSSSESCGRIISDCVVTNDQWVFEMLMDCFNGERDYYSECEKGAMLEWENKFSCLHVIDDIEDDIKLPSRCTAILITVSPSLSGLQINNDAKLFSTAYRPIMEVAKAEKLPVLFIVPDGMTTFECNALAVPVAARLGFNPQNVGAIEMEDLSSFAKLLLFSRSDLPTLSLPMESSLRAVLNLTASFSPLRHEVEWIQELMEDFVCDGHNRESIIAACNTAFEEEQCRFESFVIHSRRQPVTNRLEFLEEKFDEMRMVMQDSLQSPYCIKKMAHLQRARSNALPQTRDIDALLQACGDIEFEHNLKRFVGNVESEWKKRFINVERCDICIPTLEEGVGEVFYLMNLQAVKCVDFIQVKCVFESLEDAIFAVDYLTRRCGGASVVDRVCDVSYGPPTIDVYVKDCSLKVRTPWCVASILIHFVLMIDVDGDGSMLRLYEEWRDIERALYSKQHMLILSNDRHNLNAETQAKVSGGINSSNRSNSNAVKNSKPQTPSSTSKWEGLPTLGSNVKVKGHTGRHGVVRFIGKLSEDDCVDRDLDKNEVVIGVSFSRRLYCKKDECKDKKNDEHNHRNVRQHSQKKPERELASLKGLTVIDANGVDWNTDKYFGKSLDNLKYNYFVSMSQIVWCSQRSLKATDIIPGKEVMILHTKRRNDFGFVHGMRYGCCGEKQVFVEVYDERHRDIVVDGTIMVRCKGTGKIVNACRVKVMPALDTFASYADLVSMHCQRQRSNSMNVLMTPASSGNDTDQEDHFSFSSVEKE